MIDDSIRRSDVIDELMHIIPYKRYHNGEYILLLNKKECLSAIKAIPSAPSIDIVRCKECKWVRYCETEDLDLYLDCDKPDGGGIPRSEEWFCADGERESE